MELRFATSEVGGQIGGGGQMSQNAVHLLVAPLGGVVAECKPIVVQQLAGSCSL